MARPIPRETPFREDYGQGSYRRCILLEADAGRVTAELADDFHHFGVRLDSEGGRVSHVEGEDVRVPWTTCPGALAPLQALRGAALSTSFIEVSRYSDPKAQCTHLYDLACLAICHAARQARGGAATRRYDIVLPDRRSSATRPVLSRDGEVLLEWSILGQQIDEARPAAFAGLSLGGTGFHRFVRRELDEDLAEATLVLRRAIFIGLGRRYDFDQMPTARAFEPIVGSACHTFDPSRIDQAERIVGSVRDFHDRPEDILQRDAEGH